MTRFLVTGTPRAATKFAARLFTALGVPCWHEGTVRPLTPLVELLRWYRDGEGGESSWMSWTVQPLFPRPLPMLHTIRNPWSVIDSLCNRNSILKPEQLHSITMNALRDTIEAYTPRVWRQQTRVDRAAALVVDWNAAIAKAFPDRCQYYADRLTPGSVAMLLRFIGVERSTREIAHALDEVGTKVNTGYTINDTPGISDPDVARWVGQYAESIGADVFTRKIENTPRRQSTNELAAIMSPKLLEDVNQFAAKHGYPVVSAVAAA